MGIGYGRNGKYFIKNGYEVDGIEYSEEAINIGRKFCPEINFIKGSVLDIDLDKQYDGIFCYSILHLFQKNDRQALLENCIKHCKENGIIVISCCSIKDKAFGIGEKIEENTFEIKQGKIIHFYNEEEIQNLHKKAKLIEYNYSAEIIETEERKEEYNMIYGIYKKIVDKSKNSV
jgi:2-polyprenyl-3-methyl-5-hydroxy-6-metoxy-1,4-benzoquinol methylase